MGQGLPRGPQSPRILRVHLMRRRRKSDGMRTPMASTTSWLAGGELSCVTAPSILPLGPLGTGHSLGQGARVEWGGSMPHSGPLPPAVPDGAGPGAILHLDQPLWCCRLPAAATGPGGEPLCPGGRLHHQGGRLEPPGGRGRCNRGRGGSSRVCHPSLNRRGCASTCEACPGLTKPTPTPSSPGATGWGPRMSGKPSSVSLDHRNPLGLSPSCSTCSTPSATPVSCLGLGRDDADPPLPPPQRISA